METLYLSNDLTGSTELCSLFLHPDYRSGNNGKLLSKSRFLFIAQFPHLFTEKLIAEMRGYQEESGRSPFWEGLGRQFFAMEYSTTRLPDRHRAEVLHRRIDAQAPGVREPAAGRCARAIGAVHTDTEPARTMLEQEGFRYEGYVDIFDAGPTLECFRDNIYAVRPSQVLPVTLGEEDPVPDSLTDDVRGCRNRSLADFRAIVVTAPARADRFPLMAYAAGALRCDEGDMVRAVPFAPRIKAMESTSTASRADAQLLRTRHGNLASEHNMELVANPRDAALRRTGENARAGARGLPQACCRRTNDRPPRTARTRVRR